MRVKEWIKKADHPYWLILFLILLVSFIIEFFYRIPLFDASEDFIYNYQQDYESSEGFYKFITLFGNGYVFVIIVIFVLNFGSITSFIMLYLSTAYANIGTTFLKLCYHRPRPYYEFDKIDPISCSQGFGNPSGHAFNTTSFYFGVIYLILLLINKYIHKINHEEDKKTWQIWMLKGLQLLIIIGFAILIILVCLSRVYLASHSLNQIIYGANLGIILAVGIYILGHKHIAEDLNKMGITKSLTLLAKSILVVFGVYTVFAYLMMMIIPNTDIKDELHEDDWREVIKEKCQDKEYYEYAENNNLRLGVLCGNYLYYTIGIYFSFKYPKTLYLVEGWLNVPWWKKLLRSLLTIIQMIISFIPIFIGYAFFSQTLLNITIFIICQGPLLGLSFFSLGWLSIKLKLYSPLQHHEQKSDEEKPDNSSRNLV